jgi:hypothetical protein
MSLPFVELVDYMPNLAQTDSCEELVEYQGESFVEACRQALSILLFSA